MFLNEITINEVAKEMTKSNPKKGFGVDGLSPKVVQCIANYITEPLTHIFNLSFRTCKIPHSSSWTKIPTSHAGLQSRWQQTTYNYRPIYGGNEDSEFVARLKAENAMQRNESVEFYMYTPEDLRNTKSQHSVKKKLKEYLLSQQCLDNA